MTVTPSNYLIYYRPGNQVTVGIHLPDKTFAEDSATIISITHEMICLELCGKGFPPQLPIAPGSKTVLTKLEGRTLFLRNGTLTLMTAGRCLQIQLADRVQIMERREYARTDIAVPLHYSLPASQNMGRILREWDEKKNCGGVYPVEDRSDLASPGMQSGNSVANLSGSGLRFKIRDCLSYGTLLHLQINMPGKPQDQIHAVGSIVRTKELLPQMDHETYYSTSMALKVIDSNDRQKLVTYLLNEQRRTIL